jgi:hypothetical protein
MARAIFWLLRDGQLPAETSGCDPNMTMKLLDATHDTMTMSDDNYEPAVLMILICVVEWTTDTLWPHKPYALSEVECGLRRSHAECGEFDYNL